jgi:hypothetical protein
MVLMALGLTVAVAACGSNGDDSSEQKKSVSKATTPQGEVRQVYAGFVDAFYSQDPQGACATMTPAVQRQIGQKASCQEALGKLFESPPGKLKPYIVALKVKRNRASATVKTKTSQKYPVRFARNRSGEWKISGGLR